MRRPFVVFLITSLLMGGKTAIAQDQNNPDILKKELAETMSQLKAAQDRKNELANEYEKLKAQLATMQKQLDDANRALAEHAEHTYALRSQQAAWSAFLDRDPRLRARWELYLETSIADLTNGTDEWMLELPKSKSLFEASTQPTTTPTTAPAAATPSTIPAVVSQPASAPTTTTTSTAPATTPAPPK